MTAQTFKNQHGDEVYIEHHTDTDVPGTVEVRLEEGSIWLEPDLAVRVGLALAPIVVIGPDDHLVLKLDPAIDESEAEEMRRRMVEHMPRLAGRVLYVVGTEPVFVVRAGEAASE